MQRFSPPGCQTVFRAVLLFGVLTGLLFSCGEGIRLFPFPTAETGQNNPSKLKNGEELDYEKNLHRFETNQGNPQSKIQRENPPVPHWTKACHAFGDLSFSVSNIGLKTDISPGFRNFQSRILSAARGCRAPPVS